MLLISWPQLELITRNKKEEHHNGQSCKKFAAQRKTRKFTHTYTYIDTLKCMNRFIIKAFFRDVSKLFRSIRNTEKVAVNFTKK